jgi:hypothetical protein
MTPMCDSTTLDPRWIGATIQKEHWHFHRQLLDRYGIVLAPGDFSKMQSDLADGRALMVRRLRGEQAIYSIRIASVGERIYVLAAKQNIITAWPPQKRLNDIRRALLEAARSGHAPDQVP